ncbi:response regulator transcription factor [Microbispora sp. NEAU-D428]|uniref:LuxR C-terminal-related transcriptional regulator n=1 Tax=Microbispora sitophila TaxID=2771537 RepID=UPI001868411D|nr:response regulator transcription factor [Microbispora sitophila]MBE3012648.1 response regulator transcription factor [Microbispora sitophila]
MTMTDSSGAITIVVADDHPLFVEGIRYALEQAADLSVVGTACDDLDALRLCVRLSPQVLLADLAMLGALGSLRRRCPAVRVLALGADDGEAGFLGALRAGASGYLLKGSGPAEIAAAVRSVALGQVVFGGGLAPRLLDRLTTPQVRSPFPGLTQREHEILERLADGRSNAEIARELCLATKTVRNHVSNVLTKLAAPSRVDAALRARDAGLGSRPVFARV